MSMFVTCGSCGARNGSEAVWCTMCFEPLQAPEPEPEAGERVAGERVAGEPELPSLEADVSSVQLADEPVVVTFEPETTVAAASSGAPSPGDGDEEVASESTWTCQTCDTVNSIVADVCSVCGSTIFESMGAEPDEITLTQDQGLRLGLMPGLAHARLGEPIVGFLIALLVLACLAFGIVFITSGGPVWGLIVGLVGLVTWGVSIFDVNQRIAGAAPILRPRMMTMIGAIVILLIMVAGFTAGASAVRSPGT